MIPRHIGSMQKTSDKDGIIFDIQKFSIHDGPGIRTVVFLKGCPLRCSWCANPESQSKNPELMWLESLCRHCHKCENLCPEGALTESAEGLKKIDRSICTACGICDENCYATSMQLVGRYVSVSEVLREVEKDRPFYDQSGGGITLSGGEPLAQPDFARELLQESKRLGLHTVVETSGGVPWRNIEPLAQYVDLFLYDIKAMDSETHKRYTGVPNESILSNAEKLSALGAQILVRVPLIPGINDSEENIRLTAEFAKRVNAQGVEILEYHNLGTPKYKRLDMEYRLRDVQPPTEEVVKNLKSICELRTGHEQDISAAGNIPLS